MALVNSDYIRQVLEAHRQFRFVAREKEETEKKQRVGGGT